MADRTAVCMTCARTFTAKPRGYLPRTCPTCPTPRRPSSRPEARQAKHLETRPHVTCARCGDRFQLGLHQKLWKAVQLCGPCEQVVAHCTQCDVVKPRTEFPKATGRRTGVGASCRVCTRGWYAKQDSVARNARKYGLTAEQWRDLLSAQGSICAVCGCSQDDAGAKGFVVDHCHATGRVRGILCSRCNTGIGLLRDDPAIVQAAVNYLLQGE